MAKHNILTEEEFLQFHPNTETIKFLEIFFYNFIPKKMWKPKL